VLPEMRKPDSAYPKADTFSRWYFLDYFRRGSGMQRRRAALSAAAVLLAFTAMGWAYWAERGRMLQSGPVSEQHAASANDCQVCHTTSFATATRFWNADARSVPDGACTACHPKFAGPSSHHPNADDRNCAACHQEHRGRAALARVPDEDCAACHRDPHQKGGARSDLKRVTRFAGDHPEFAVLREKRPDPAALHFNHALHLKADLRGAAAPLGCSACHTPEPSGRHMRPIDYRAHCAACHPLSVPLDTTSTDPAVLEAAAKFRAAPAPHVAPEKVRAALRDRLADFARANPRALDAPAAEGPEPLSPAPPAARPDDVNGWAAARQTVADRVLFGGAGGCRLCHVPDADFVEGRVPPDYRPTRLTEPRMPRASFSHAAEGHRALDCVSCHKKPTSTKSADVDLPGADSCKKCHAPGGSARFDCAECHRYHQALRPAAR
jgi:hypothetical protein